MSLEKNLHRKILAEAKKLALRYHAYHNALHIEHERNKKRIEDAPPKHVKTPECWDVDDKFNPFHVLKKSRQISKSIARKIKNKSYKPFPPHIMEVPKKGGGVRKVAVYQIPDAAVSSLYYEQLLSKNKHRFSAFSYAYRNDRNVHFAIQDITIDLVQHARTFVSEFDFSDFFGTISHRYLTDQFDKNGFFISKEERFIINAFLPEGGIGIPQGTSISLFLANLVCWEMDKEFERNGLRFARYADDTVVWSQDYGEICKSFEIINAFSQKTGVNINPHKSDGISLLSREGLPAELKSSKHDLDFLGYSISVDKVSIKEESVKKIKKQISYILYRNLIQPLKGSALKALKIPANNEDSALLTAIHQIRRYLYGGLSEAQIRNYLSGRTKRLYFKGLMSYYPLITDEEQLKSLDGWLVSVVYRSIQLRSKLLLNWGFDRKHQFPFNTSRVEFVGVCGDQIINGKKLLQIPSFLRIYRAMKKGLVDDGIEVVMHPASNKYDY